MVKITREKKAANQLEFTQLVVGRAYELVSCPQQAAAAGRIYLHSYGGLINLSNGDVRRGVCNDRFVEVDLEITVKEKN